MVCPHAQSLPSSPDIHLPSFVSNPSLYEKLMIPEPHRAFISGNPIISKQIMEVTYNIIVYIGQTG
jgi:hypothetical protein